MAPLKVIKLQPASSAVRFILYILLIVLPSIFTTVTADPTEIKKLILTISLLIIALIIFVGLASGKRMNVKRMPLDLPILAFLLCNFISAFGAKYKWATIPEMGRMLSYVLIYFLASRCLVGNDNIRKTFYVLALSSVIPCIYGIIQHFALDPIEWAHPSYERVLASFGNPTYFAAYLVLVIPITLMLYLDEENTLLKWGLLVLTGTQLACLLWTYSRGPWIGLLVALAVGFVLPAFLAARSLMLERKMRICLGAFVLTAVVVAISIGGGIVERAKTSLDMGDLSNVQRALQWKAGYCVFLEHPIIGVGPGALKIYMPENLTPSFFYTGIATASEHAHNEFIEVAAETGIVGLVIFLWVLTVAFVSAVRSPFGKALIPWVLAGAILGFLICNLVGVAMRYSVDAVYFWVFLGLLSGIAKVGKRQKELWFGCRAGIHSIPLWIFALLFFIGASALSIRLFIASIEQKRADNLFVQDRIEEAIPIYRKTLLLNPYNVDAKYNLAICYTKLGDYNAALSTYASLERLWPDIGRIHFNKGTIYAAMGNLILAKKELERAAKIDGLPDTWEYLSRVYYALGDESKAIEAANNAAQAASKIPQTLQ